LAGSIKVFSTMIFFDYLKGHSLAVFSTMIFFDYLKGHSLAIFFDYLKGHSLAICSLTPKKKVDLHFAGKFRQSFFLAVCAFSDTFSSLR
jgi:hypothetical protein